MKKITVILTLTCCTLCSACAQDYPMNSLRAYDNETYDRQHKQQHSLAFAATPDKPQAGHTYTRALHTAANTGIHLTNDTVTFMTPEPAIFTRKLKKVEIARK